MPLLLLKDLPKFDCLTKAAERFPSLEPDACEAFLHLLHVSDRVSHVVERRLSTHRVSEGRFTVLMLLGKYCDQGLEPATPATLADEAGVTRATMTGLLDTLEKDHLILREPDPADRRVIRVRLTEQGRELLDGILPDHFRCVAELMRPLNHAERKELVRLLAKVQAGLPEKES